MDAERLNPGAEIAPLDRIIAAVLFVAPEALSTEKLAERLPEWPLEAIERSTRRLRDRFVRERRPYVVEVLPGVVQLKLLEEFRRALQAKAGAERSFRLNRVLLEVLSLVAYRQPISRASLEDQLGADVANSLRTLQKRQLIAAVENADGRGPPAFVTTDRFLEIFGLESLADLPAFGDSP